MSERISSFLIVLCAWILGAITASMLFYSHTEKVCAYVRYQGAQIYTLECWRELH